MTLLVCGGRSFRNAAWLRAALDALQPDRLMEGGGSGADALARGWARDHGVPTITYFAAWDRYGRSAGPRRNQQMLDEGKPDLVLACPGGKGTADMVTRAQAAGVQVLRLDEVL